MTSRVLLLFSCLLVLNVASSRHLPNYSELEKDEQHLFRAAYDAPPYHDDYQPDYQEDDLGKVDLLKDGLWALKAKMKELKAFDKALAANLLATKLQVKELLQNHLGPLKTHHHEKPAYNSYSYQSAPYQPPYAAALAYPAAPAPAPAPAPQVYAHDPYYGH